VNSSVTAITANGNLVKKSVGFPSELLVIIKVLTNSIAHLIGTGLLLLIVGVLSGLTPYFPLLFLYMFFIALFAVGIGWMLSSINVYLKDIQKVMGLVMIAWFFFTPVFYSPHIIPSAALSLIKMNPMYHAVIGYRYAILAGRFLPWQEFLYLAAVSFFTFGIGGILFRKLKPGFAEVL
jgi:ABC-type polysaccharide/polyol phosphate export permease